MKERKDYKIATNKRMVIILVIERKKKKESWEQERENE